MSEAHKLPLTSEDGAFSCIPSHAVEAAYLLNTAEGVLMEHRGIEVPGDVANAILAYCRGDMALEEARNEIVEIGKEAEENSRKKEALSCPAR